MKIKTIAFLLLSVPVWAQHKPNYELQKVIPPAPTSAALGQYGNTPVGLYTGTANVSIPIYTIQQNDVQLPISLNYSTGGIKVAEYASWTGLGWNLSAGGLITRTTYGKPDEWGYLAETIPVPTTPTPEQLEDADDWINDFQPDFFTFNFAGHSGKFYIKKNNEIVVSPHQNIKIEPLAIEDVTCPPPFMDIVPQYTQWRITTEDGTQYEFKDMEKTTRRSYDPNNPGNVNVPEPGPSAIGSVSAWYLSKIKSPGGSEINFTYTDYTLRYDMPGSQQFFYMYYSSGSTVPGKPNPNSNTRFNTANKRLSSITFRTGKVEFVAGASRCDLIGDKMLTAVIIRDKSNNIIRKVDLSYLYQTPGGLAPPSAVSCANMTNLLTYEANALNRNYRLMLNSVTESDSSGTVVGRKYQLEYYSPGSMPERNSRSVDHWGYSNGATFDPEERPFLTLYGKPLDVESNYYIQGRDPSLIHTLSCALQKITYPTGGTSTFEYELNNAYVGYGELPPIVVRHDYALAIDYSVYNTMSQPYYLQDGTRIYYQDFSLSEPMMIDINIKGFAHQPISPIGMRFDIVNRATNGRVVTMNEIDLSGVKNVNTTLSTVEYTYLKQLPAGNYRITFQPDEYFIDNMIYATTYQQIPSFTIKGWEALVESGMVGHITRTIGGLRLRKMTDTDIAANNQIIKAYTYEVMDSTVFVSSGSILNAARYVYKYDENIAVDVSGPSQSPVYETVLVKYMVIGNEPNYPLYTTQGGNVGYRAVQVYEVDASNNTKRKTEYVYTSPKDYQDVFGGLPTSLPTQPYPPADSRDWLRGLLLSQTDYRNESGTFIPVRKIEHNYGNVVFLGEVPGLAQHVNQRNVVYPKEGSAYVMGRSFVYKSYNFSSGYILLSSTRDTIFSPGGNIATVKEYGYASAPRHLYPTSEKAKDSRNGWRVVERKYPQDYAGLTGTDNLTKGIKNLQTLFVVSQPVETTFYITDPAGGNKKMTGSQFVSYHPTMPFPSEIAAMEVSVPMAGFTPSTVTGGAVTRHSGYRPRVLFTSYGEFGTLREQQKVNDRPETIIWGYDFSYPVAKVIGSNFNTVMGFVTQPANLQQPATEAAVLTELDKIHNGLSGNSSQVVTYTYKPLIGAISERSPQRQITRYEYDGLGRLKLVRDHTGKIIKLVDYQYQSTVQ